MKVQLLHPPKNQQPVAAILAAEIAKAIPEVQTCLASTDEPQPGDAQLVVPVFCLRQGSFAPTVAAYRALRGVKLAFVAALTGDVNAARVRKSIWGSKKQFCGNELLGAYLCPAADEAAWGVSELELDKCRHFLRRVYLRCLNEMSPLPLVANS